MTVLPVAILINFVGRAYGGVLLPVFLPTDLLGMFLFGIGMGPANPLLQTLVQIRTPEQMLGRVLSAIFTLFTVAAPLGSLAAGFAIDAIGLRTSMIVAAALLSAVPLWIGLSPWSRAIAPAFDE
jgi:MFS family permease